MSPFRVLWLFAVLLNSALASSSPNFRAPTCQVPAIQNGVVTFRNGTAIKPRSGVLSGTRVILKCQTNAVLAEGSANATACLVDETGNGAHFDPPLGYCRSLRARPDQCGSQAQPSHSNNDAGLFAKLGEFPWMARLEIAVTGQRRPSLCAASLISSEYLLTAAHCLDGNIRSVVAILGRANFSHPSEESSEQRFYILPEDIKMHPEYSRTNGFQNDFALVRLNPPALLRSNVRTLCLPDESICDPENYDGKEIDQCSDVQALGWSQDGTANRSLRKADLSVVSREECEDLGIYQLISDNQLCAASSFESQGACFGASGGPLVCQDPETGFYRALGLSSYGVNCGENEIPSVYARVCSALPWIYVTLESAAPLTTARPLRRTRTAATTLAPTSRQRTIVQRTSQRVSTTTKASAAVTTTRRRRVQSTEWSLVSCIVPPVKNGYYYSDGAEVLEGANFKVGQELELYCKDGFELKNEEIYQFVCTAAAKWDPEPEKTGCRELGCFDEELPKVENGFYVETLRGGAVPFSTIRTLKCVDGYEVKDAPSVRCQITSNWSAPGSCQRIVVTTTFRPVENVTSEDADDSFNHSEVEIEPIESPSSTTKQPEISVVVTTQATETSSVVSRASVSRRLRTTTVTATTTAQPSPVDSSYDETLSALLYDAVKAADWGSVSLLLTSNDTNSSLIDVNWRNASDDDTTPLLAILAQCQILTSNETSAQNVVKIVELLLNKGANVEAQESSSNLTALMLASTLCQNASSSNMQLVMLLLDEGASVNATDVSGNTALILASGLGQYNIVAMLLDAGSNVNQTNLEGWSALMNAATNRRVDVVQLLLNKGAYVNLKNNDGYTALTLSIHDDGQVARLLLDKGAFIDEKDNNEQTALIVASSLGFANLTKLLIERGASVNLKDNLNETALIYAAQRGQLEIVQALVDRGALLDERNEDGDTALTLAASKGYDEVAKLLISRGASTLDCLYPACSNAQ